MSAPILREAYVYMATTTDMTDMLHYWTCKYPLTNSLSISNAAKRYIQTYGICVKIGSTTMHPSQRDYGLARDKGMTIIHTQTLHTTAAGLLLVESVLRKYLENHPCTCQIGTDTFQVFTEQNREIILEQWNEWVVAAMRIAEQI